MKYRVFITTAILLSTAYHAFGQPQSLSTAQIAQFDELVTAGVEGKAPGLAVGVIKDGVVAYERYAGYAELDHEIPIAAETRFNIASNAKQFTALCLLKLAAEGRLSLEDDVRDYLPEFYPDVAARLTIAQLITHTSGIRDVYDLWALTGKTWWKQFVGNRQALQLLQRQTELNFPPGSDYQYSNSNYLLLAEVVSRVTESKFADYASDMFQTLGMPDTSFLTGYMTIVPHRARSYGNWGSWKQYPSVTSLHGDGNLFTTLGDQMVWEIAIQRGISAAFNEDLVAASQAAIQGQATETYGFGVELGTYRGREDRSHAGSTGAYGAYFIRLPEERLSVVVMSNSGGVSARDVALGCVDAVLGVGDAEDGSGDALFPAGPDAVGARSPISDLVGDYLTPEGTFIKIVTRDGELIREIFQRDPVRLIHEAGDLYCYESNAELKMAFSGSARERQMTIFYPQQAPIEAARLPLVEMEPGIPRL